MRAFIAIELSDELKKKVSEFQAELRKKDFLIGNWTKDYHLTLKFLGEITAEKQKEIEKILEEIANETKSFELELSGLGAFPSQDYIRVLWVGAGKGDGQAKALQKEIDERLVTLGFARERNFTNHLTLCRVKVVNDKQMLQKLFETKIGFDSFEVSEIKLIKSTLTGAGPVYETLKEFKLRD